MTMQAAVGPPSKEGASEEAPTVNFSGLQGPSTKITADLIRPLLDNYKGVDEDAQMLAAIIRRCAEQGGWETQIHLRNLWSQLFRADERGPSAGWEDTLPATAALVRLANKGYILIVDGYRLMVTRKVPELVRTLKPT